MDEHLADLLWRGLKAANPWWSTGAVPEPRTSTFRRHAFAEVYRAYRACEAGRGITLLGPRRVGKSVLLHQVVGALLADRVPPTGICFLSLDDVALRHRDLGEILEVLDTRLPTSEAPRHLLIDEVQHSPDWAGWLKRIADRRDPYVFLATGSSATALMRGGQDAGLGRWREMTLFPWSFREHANLLAHAPGAARRQGPDGDADWPIAGLDGEGPISDHDAERLDAMLTDYLLRGGYPEAALAEDLVEARRRLRDDILDRALGRDVTDAVDVESAVLERMFLRICLNPGGLWNASEVGNDLKVTRQTATRYLSVLERAFLVFRLPNLGSPVKGLPKVYLVSPSVRAALLNLDEGHLETPEEWGRMAENAVAATLVGTRPAGRQVGFWRQGTWECDGVVLDPAGSSEYVEVKHSGARAVPGLLRAMDDLRLPGRGVVLARRARTEVLDPARGVERTALALWLYRQDDSAGGTLRVKLT